MRNEIFKNEVKLFKKANCENTTIYRHLTLDRRYQT